MADTRKILAEPQPAPVSTLTPVTPVLSFNAATPEPDLQPPARDQLALRAWVVAMQTGHGSGDDRQSESAAPVTAPGGPPGESAVAPSQVAESPRDGIVAAPEAQGEAQPGPVEPGSAAKPALTQAADQTTGLLNEGLQKAGDEAEAGGEGAPEPAAALIGTPEPGPTEEAAAAETAPAALETAAPPPAPQSPQAEAAPELDRWKAQVQASAQKIAPPSLEKVKGSGQALRSQGGELNAKRKTEKADPTAKARQKVKPTPKVEQTPPPVPPNPVPGAIARVNTSSDRRLPDQTLPAPTRSPGHPRLDNGRGQYPSLMPRIPQDTSQPPEAAAPAAGAAPQPSPAVKQVQKKVEEQKPVQPPEATGEPVKLVDQGPPPEKPLPPETKADLTGALATVVTQKSELAQGFVNAALDGAYPRKALREAAPTILDEDKPTEEQGIQGEIDRVAAASQISQAALDQKVAAVKQEIAETGGQAATDLKTAGGEVKQETEARGQQTQDEIAQAATTVKLETEQKQAAATGENDPTVVKAKRDRLLDDVGNASALGKARFRQALEKRKGDLDDSGRKQRSAYALTSEVEARAIRALYTDDTEGRLQAKPSLDWGYRGGKETAEAVELFKQKVEQTAAGFIAHLVSETDLAREMIRGWANEKLTEEQNWLERLIEMFRDWFSQAQKDVEQWQQAEAALTRDELVADFAKLDEIRSAIQSGNEQQVQAAVAGLSAEQQLVVKTFFASGGNGVQAVAMGLILRLQQKHVPKLTEHARDKALALDWVPLNDLGKAEDPSFDAREIARQVYDAVAGIGTNEAQIFAALNRRTKTQIEAVRKVYVRFYGETIEEALEDDLSGEEEKRAMAQLQGDHIGADVAALREAVRGAGTDEGTIMSVLRHKTPAEREEIMRRYKEEYDVDLMTALGDDLNEREMERATALLAGNVAKADAIAMDDALHGGWFGADRDAADAVYKDIENDVKKEAGERGMTTAEMEVELRQRNKQMAGEYDKLEGRERQEGALERDFKDKFSGPDLDLIQGLHDYDPAKIDAARIRIERNSFFVTSDAKMNDLLRNQHKRAEEDVNRDLGVKLKELHIRAVTEKWPPEKLAKEKEALQAQSVKDIERKSHENMQKLESTYDSAYSTFGPGRLRLDIAFTMSGTSQDMAYDLLRQGGKLEPAQEVYYAVKGAGTDEKALREALKGKSKEEIKEIRKRYKELYKRKLDDDIFDDVSGRDKHDMEIALEGKPETPEEMMALLERKKKWELENGGGWFGIGKSLADTETEALEIGYGDAKQSYDAYQAAKAKYQAEHPGGDPNTDPEVLKAKARFDQFGGYVEGDIEQYRKGVDRAADYIATAAEITVVVAVAIAAGVFSGGTGTVATLAAYLGTTAGGVAITAGVAAGAGILARAAIKGDAYGVEDFLVDSTVGVVDAAASAATFGTSKALLKAGKLAAMARGNVAKRFLAHAAAEGAEGALGGVAPALAAALLSDQTWEGPYPFLAVLQGAGMGLAMGGGMGGLAGGLGGLRKAAPPRAPETGDILAKRGTPQDRLAAWKQHKAEYPDASMKDFLRQYDEQVAKQIADADAAKQLQRQRRTEYLQDLPVSERGKVPKDVSLIRDADGNLVPAGSVLPKDLRRSLPVEVDPALGGSTVRVHYDVDPKTGVVRNVRMRVGPHVRPVDLQLHVDTARAIQRYAGLSGRVRLLLDRMKSWVTKHGPLRPGTLAFEAHLEMEKLPAILRERAALLQAEGLDPLRRRLILEDIADLQRQYDGYARMVRDLEAEPGRGFVAAESKLKGTKEPTLKQGPVKEAPVQKPPEGEPADEAPGKVPREEEPEVGPTPPKETGEAPAPQEAPPAAPQAVPKTYGEVAPTPFWAKVETRPNSQKNVIDKLDSLSRSTAADLGPLRESLTVEKFEQILRQLPEDADKAQRFMYNMNRFLSYAVRDDNAAHRANLGKIFDGLASADPRTRETARYLMERVSAESGQGVQRANRILSKIELPQVKEVLDLHPPNQYGYKEVEIFNALDSIAAKVEGDAAALRDLIRKAGVNATDAADHPDVLRLAQIVESMGAGPHAPAAVAAKVKRLNELAQEIANLGDEFVKGVFKDWDEIVAKFGRIKQPTPTPQAGKAAPRKTQAKKKTSTASPDEVVAGSPAALYFRQQGRVNGVVEAIVGKAKEVNQARWTKLAEAIEATNLDPSIKNNILGFYWEEVNLQRLRNAHGEDRVLDQVVVGIEGKKGKARIDGAVITVDEQAKTVCISFEEYKASDTAPLSDAQTEVKNIVDKKKGNAIPQLTIELPEAIWAKFPDPSQVTIIVEGFEVVRPEAPKGK